jgi:hypothetical protein
MRQTNIATYGLDYIKRELMANQVERYRQYRAINPSFLKNDHILNRIMGMVDIPFDGDLPDYYLRVSEIVNRIAGQMGMVTSAHHGRTRDKSQFYGDGVTEIIIAVSNDDISPSDIWFNWRKLSPIRVLSHPIMGCGIIELNGTSSFKGLHPGATAVIEIDIPLLACQYHLWRMAISNTSSAGASAPMAHFMTQVIIPNMLGSHLDVAILNTIHSIIGSTDYIKVDSNMPFFTTDYYPKLMDGLKELVGRFSRETYVYKEILMNIPVFEKDTLFQVIQMPDIAFTNQAIWALIIARMPLIAMLLKFDELSSNQKNDSDRNRIKRCLIEIESGKYLVNQVPSDVSTNARAFIDKNIRPYL